MRLSVPLRLTAEVLAVWVLLQVVVRVWNTTSFQAREWELLAGSYASHTLFAAVTIALLVLTGSRIRDWGLSLSANMRTSAVWGVLVGSLLAAPVAGALALGWTSFDVPRLWLSVVVFQIVFAGFGEEILYRGYIQSRLNRAFGRPFEVEGIRFGMGLIVASAAFGVAHLLNPFNPFLGRQDLDWFACAVALQTGVYYGFLRDKLGSILAPAIIHASTFWWDFIADTEVRVYAMSVGWSLAWIVLFTVLSHRQVADGELDARAAGPAAAT